MIIFTANTTCPMSHLHERKEKVCLNCGASLIGRYCQDCGQENVEPKESIGHLVTHFFNDVTHFDGKFFSSMKYLLLKPGFLTEEYTKGRRAAYLNPIRMYLFISAMFFLVLMTFFVDRAQHAVTTTRTTTQKKPTTLRKGISTIRHTLDSLAVEQEDSAEVAAIDSALAKADAEPNNVHEYDSIQAALPKAQRDGFIDRYFNRRTAAMRSYGKEHSGEVQHRMIEQFFHSMPYMLFISLPLIALLLKLLYVRRKQFYYVSHIIFLLHYYCIIFIAFFFILLTQRLPYGGIAASLFFIGYIAYLYFAMLRFYKQGWFKTFVKYFLFVFLAGFVVSILTLLLALNSIFNAVA